MRTVRPSTGHSSECSCPPVITRAKRVFHRRPILSVFRAAFSKAGLPPSRVSRLWLAVRTGRIDMAFVSGSRNPILAECAPVACPVCGGLECLCRPRFFAGQLLTDEDLKRLDHYVVAKDRLHNRYLHGPGSVCGLEVVCNPCDYTVTVRSGYAIGPCGEDIVVCRDTAVDVGDLI